MLKYMIKLQKLITIFKNRIATRTTAILSIMRTQTFKQSAGTWFFAAVNQHKKISKLKNNSQKTHQMETKYDFELNYGSFGRRMYLVLNLFEF